MRIYKDASFIIATTDGSKISSIVFEGSNLGSSYISATGYDGTDTWSGSETSVTFNCIKSTIQINKVTITTAASGAQESVDWVLLYYVGTVVLNMSEKVFWRSTLRKLHAVFKCHCEHMPKPAGKK